MSFGGSVQGMISTLKSNAMLLRKKNIFKKERTFLNLRDANFKLIQVSIPSKK